MRCRAVLAQAASVPVAALAGTAGALVSDYFRAPQSHGAHAMQRSQRVPGTFKSNVFLFLFL